MTFLGNTRTIRKMKIDKILGDINANQILKFCADVKTNRLPASHGLFLSGDKTVPPAKGNESLDTSVRCAVSAVPLTALS